jgi:hypothetical protein
VTRRASSAPTSTSRSARRPSQELQQEVEDFSVQFVTRRREGPRRLGGDGQERLRPGRRDDRGPRQGRRPRRSRRDDRPDDPAARDGQGPDEGQRRSSARATASTNGDRDRSSIRRSSWTLARSGSPPDEDLDELALERAIAARSSPKPPERMTSRAWPQPLQTETVEEIHLPPHGAFIITSPEGVRALPGHADGAPSGRAPAARYGGHAGEGPPERTGPKGAPGDRMGRRPTGASAFDVAGPAARGVRGDTGVAHRPRKANRSCRRRWRDRARPARMSRADRSDGADGADGADGPAPGDQEPTRRPGRRHPGRRHRDVGRPGRGDPVGLAPVRRRVGTPDLRDRSSRARPRRRTRA